MRTKNAMQLKARISNKAKEAGIPAQALMQSYLMERLLERLSKSKWQPNVVVKGGMLISSLVGVASRTTMDLDTTVRGFDLTHESAESVFRQIAELASDDDWTFEFDRTEDIRETDDYPGIRVHLKALYPPMAVPLTIDVTTGDKITPTHRVQVPAALRRGLHKPHGIHLGNSARREAGDRRLARSGQHPTPRLLRHPRALEAPG